MTYWEILAEAWERKNRRLSPWLLVLVLGLLVPSVIHSIFHLLDWAVWGLGLTSSAPREILSPYFQDATGLGLLVHAGVNLTALILMGVLLVLVVRK